MGRIEVITGGMYAGKTEELIRRIKRAQIANKSVVCFKHSVDNRYKKEAICTHYGYSIDAIVVNDADHLFDLVMTDYFDVDVIAADEIQFFDNDVVTLINDLANLGKRVIVSGLDTNFQAQPFGPIGALMTIAESVTKLSAICVKCGEEARFNKRLNDSKDEIMIGDTDKYEARCRKCFFE